MSSPRSFLAKLAPMSAAGWHALGAEMFPGELSVATDNGVYRFEDGVFRGRVHKHERSFFLPSAMRGLRLIGFLHDEGGGMWSLSPRWRDGAHAVLWKQGETDEQSFLLTSPTRQFTLEEPEPKPANPEPMPMPWVARTPAESGVMRRHATTTHRPSIGLRRPLPASTTRIHSAMPAPVTP